MTNVIRTQHVGICVCVYVRVFVQRLTHKYRINEKRWHKSICLAIYWYFFRSSRVVNKIAAGQMGNTHLISILCVGNYFAAEMRGYAGDKCELHTTVINTFRSQVSLSVCVTHK